MEKTLTGIEEGLVFARDAKTPAVILVAKDDWAATLAEVVRLRARVNELLEANNRLVERARSGQAVLAHQHAKMTQIADLLLGLASEARTSWKDCGP